jgi:hypothetical protein
MPRTDRENLKRRAPESALGLATARFGDWARPFPGYDRTSQLVPSLWGRARIAGGATAGTVANARKTFQNPEPDGKEKTEKTQKPLR